MKLKKLGVGILSIAVLVVGGTTAFASTEGGNEFISNMTSSVKVMKKGEMDKKSEDKEMLKKEVVSELIPSVEATEAKDGETLKTPEGVQMMEKKIID
ncbi:MAG: hypothetical protein ACRC3Y_03915 [Romboutsia sp.]|uniref:hypothetical protein n=1 Tax=Romboutsia sp. TaxID=1965302 RepID=UPI003F340E6E